MALPSSGAAKVNPLVSLVRELVPQRGVDM